MVRNKCSILSLKFITLGLLQISIVKNSTKLDHGGHIKQYHCPVSLFESLFEQKNSHSPMYIKRYNIENHFMNTKDGYRLQIFRVRLVEEELNKLPTNLRKNFNQVILMQHALVDSADSYFFSGEKSQGYYFVNKGYDVWLGNNRGNKYSHATDGKNLESSEKENFWDYSFHEMGIYDVPAMYEYILNKVKSESSRNRVLFNRLIKKKAEQNSLKENNLQNEKDTKIIYFGHSQGTAQMFAGLSDPKSADYIQKNTKLFIASAPIAYMNHIQSSSLKAIAGMTEYSIWSLVSPILGLARLVSLNNFTENPLGNLFFNLNNLLQVFMKLDHQTVESAEKILENLQNIFVIQIVS